MPSVSEKQHKFMKKVAEDPEFSAKVGVDQEVAQRFVDEDEGSEKWEPSKHPSNESMDFDDMTDDELKELLPEEYREESFDESSQSTEDNHDEDDDDDSSDEYSSEEDYEREESDEDEEEYSDESRIEKPFRFDDRFEK